VSRESQKRQIAPKGSIESQNTNHESRFLRGAIAGLALCVGLIGNPAAADFTFAAFGDTPYSADEEARFPDLIAEMNREDLAFVVHVGDFKAAWTKCTNELYLQRRDWFGLFHHPFVFIPGDNEWADCGRYSAGGYEPLERLQKLRELFFKDSESLGQRQIALERQLPAYPEHARWRHENVLFVTLNVPGPNNNARLMPAEFQHRSAAIGEWLAQSFRIARENGLGAVVVMIQANPWGSPSSRYFGFRGLLAALAGESSRYGRPVMLIHGDTHRHRVDRPLRDPASGAPIANFTRVEVHGYPVMNWLRIRVTEKAGRVQFEVAPGS
jgi:hypothetical protein